MADKTTLAESAQALFCAIGDYLGTNDARKALDVNLYSNYADFKTIHKKTIDLAYKRINAPGVNLKDLEKFLEEDVSWYKSSVLIAKKLVDDISAIDPDFNKITRKGFQDIYYFRGDRLVMGKIEELFKIAKKNGIGKLKNQPALSDINKWSPADIYFSSDTARKEIDNAVKKYSKTPKAFTFAQLNILISDLIDSGDLLPLSLKKTTKTVVLQKVNFDRKDELKKIKKLKVKGTSDWKPYKEVPFGQKTETRDMKILIEGGELKIRHDPSAKRPVIEFTLKGAEARGGSIGSITVFTDILSLVDEKLGDDILRLYKAGDVKFKERQKELDKFKTKIPKAEFDFIRGANSAVNIINKIMPPLKKYFNSNPNRDLIIQLLYEYTTSRTALSGKFVIAK